MLSDFSAKLTPRTSPPTGTEGEMVSLAQVAHGCVLGAVQTVFKVALRHKLKGPLKTFWIIVQKGCVGNKQPPFWNDVALVHDILVRIVAVPGRR